MDIDEVLIEEVRCHKSLYDLSSEHYKNVNAKEAIWANIAKRVNLDGAVCKKRWKALRDTYRRTKQSMLLASGSAAQPGKKRWRYYDAMSFLDGVQSQRKTTSNVADGALCNSPEPSRPTIHVSVPSPSPGSETPASNPTPPPTTPTPARKVQQEFTSFLGTLSDSVERAGVLLQERPRSNPHTAAESYLLGVAKVLDQANMPDYLVQRALHNANNAVFEVLDLWNSRNMNDN